MTSSERARAVLTGTPLIDGHNDLAWEARTQTHYDWAALGFVDGTQGRTDTDLPRLRAGQVGGQFWSVYVPCSLRGGDAVTATLEQVDAVRRLAAEHPDALALATTADEVEAAHASGRIACLMGAEGGHSIDDSLAVLRMLFLLGVRYLTLTHSANTSWADSATDERVHGGLTEFGRDVVREMNRLGMLVDLSHVSHETMRDALATTAAPAIVSHSSTYALCDTPRNAPDDVLETLRDNDGVLMVTLVPYFLSQSSRDWHAEMWGTMREQGLDPNDDDMHSAFLRDWKVTHPKPRATIDDAVAHLEHARDVMGVSHLGLGGDFDGVYEMPVGLEDVSCYPTLFTTLADRGWSDDDLASLAGRNVLRVMRATEAVARG